VVELRDRSALVDRLREVGVHGDTRDERVAADGVLEQLCRLANDARHVAARVDDAVPGSARERTEVAVAIAGEVLDLREELRVRLPAREDRDVVPGGEGGVDGMAAEELRPA